MTYKLRHKKTGLFYRSQTSRGGLITNLHKDGKIYTFKPTGTGRGFYFYNLKGVQVQMVDHEWEAVEWKLPTIDQLVDSGFGSASNHSTQHQCPACGGTGFIPKKP